MTMRNFVLGGVGLVTYDDAITWNRKTPVSITPATVDFISSYDGVPCINTELTSVGDFAPGDIIKVKGSVSNDGFYIVDKAYVHRLYLRKTPGLTDEVSTTGTVTISTPAQCPIDYI